MTESRPPDFQPNDPNQEQEELILWLLGELPPDEARRVARHWRHRPQEVERWRRFLSTTDRISANLRREAERTVPGIPSPHVAAQKQSFGSAAKGRFVLPSWLAPRQLLQKLSAQVPPRLVPLAILTPVVVVFVLWLAKNSLYSPPASDLAYLSVLTPPVQVYDQGVALPSGPVRTGARIRLQSETAAARLSWSGDQCQVVISGNADLLIMEPNLGLVQQQGQAVYDVVARERPLQIWTIQGNVEIAEGRLLLTGTASYLQYEMLQGTARMTNTGETLVAGAQGNWGRLNTFEFAAIGPFPGQSPNLDGSAPAQSTSGTLAAADAAESPGTHEGESASAPPAEPPPDAAKEDGPATGTHFLYGRVVRTDDQPVGEAVLNLILVGVDSPQTRRGDRYTTTTAADGLFHFRVLPGAGRAFLRIDHPHLVADKPYREVDLDTDDQSIVLYEPSSIAGRILPPEDNALLGAVRVEVLAVRGHEGRTESRPLRGSDQERLTTRIDGELYLVAGLRPGSYRLRVETDQGQTGESEMVELGLEESRTGVEIDLESGGMFVGRVVKGDTLEGIPKAEVLLFSYSRRNRWERGRGRDGGRSSRNDDTNKEQPKASSVTSDSGDFTFRGLIPGSYEVRTTAESYNENRITVRIQAGKTSEEMIPLYDDLAVVFGRVVDGEGRAIEGARVSAEQVPERLYDEKNAVSDADGQYEFSLAPGQWSLRAQAPEDKASWARESVEIEHAARIERNFVLLSGVRVFGTVTRSGQPVAGERLYFLGETRRGNSTRTDEAGHYDILLRQGTYTLYAAGQRRATLDLLDTAEFQQDIAIADNLITGTVTDAETGETLAEVRVILESLDAADPSDEGPDPLAFFRRSRFERTNPNGYYEFTGVEPGAYRLRAISEGYAETAVSGVTVPEGSDTVLSVPLTLTFATAILEVNFTDARTGDPVAGVIAWRVTRLDTGEEILVAARPRFSDRSGFFVITNLQPGTYSMTFMQPLGDARYLPVTEPAVRVTAEGENRLNVAMQRGGTLHVSVRRPAEQDRTITVPVPRATVRITPPAGVPAVNVQLEDVTNTDGLATFGPLPSGFYSVEVNAPGHPTALNNATIQPGNPVELDITLPTP